MKSCAHGNTECAACGFPHESEAEKERAAIVAWLKWSAWDYGTTTIEMHLLDRLVEAIERGEHLKEGKKP